MESCEDIAGPMLPADLKDFSENPDRLTQRNSFVDNEHSRLDGMRREWNFTISVRHKAARAELQLVPQWTATFIDLEMELNSQKPTVAGGPSDTLDTGLDDDVVQQVLQEQRRKLEEENREGLFIPWFAYTDTTRVNKNEDDAAELIKHVELLYINLPEMQDDHADNVQEQHTTSDVSMYLKQLCKKSVQHILRNSNVFDINGETNLNNIHIKEMMDNITLAGENICLAGNKSFTFRYVSCNRKESQDAVYGCVIGTIVSKRGYLVKISCGDESELESYLSNIFLRHYRNPTRFQLDVNITYAECTYKILKDQQTTYGELYYFDKDASMSFSLPMHPMEMRADFSPLQTVGVGSVACMTFELDVYQKLCDAAVEEALAGMPTYMSNSVVLFLDVEKLAQMGYPSVMSISQYNQLKTKRLTETFVDAKLIGYPLHVNLGPRSGMSTTFTLSYDGSSKHRGVIKGMLVSTIVANLGITALYFTKLGQGIFDAYLYLFQHLLRNIKFHSEHELRGKVSRFNIKNVRLTEQDMVRAYANAPADDKGMEQHIKAIRASTDGKSEGSIIVSETPNNNKVLTVDSERLVAVPDIDLEGFTIKNEEMNDTDDSDSIVSISGIAHLARKDWPSHTDMSDTVGDRLDDSADDPLSGTDKGNNVRITIDEEVRVKTPKMFEKVVDNSSTPFVPQGAEVKGAEVKEKKCLVIVDGDNEKGSRKGSRRGSSDARHTNGDKTPVGADNRDAELDLEELQKQKDLMFLSKMTVPDKNTGYKSPNAVSVEEVLSNDDGTLYFGPSLRDIYVRCCELNSCKYNSYIYRKLPLNSRFTNSVEELDLRSNYVGHQGFQAVLMFIYYLPRLNTIIFDNMSLDNEDVRNLCECINCNTIDNERVTASSSSMRSSLRSISLRNNPKITLPSTRHLSRLIKMNTGITSIYLSGTSLGEGVIAKLERDVANNSRKKLRADVVHGLPTFTKKESIDAPLLQVEKSSTTCISDDKIVKSE